MAAGELVVAPVSWWWGAAGLSLVVAAAITAATGRRLERERSALETGLETLGPLRAEAAELRSRLLRTATRAAARRRRLETGSARRPPPVAGDRPERLR